MTFKNNRAPILSIIKLYASFQHHMWFQTGVTVQKRLSWVLTSVTLTCDLWPWPLAWTKLLSLVITPGNFMMIRRWGHSQKVWQTDGWTDRQTDRQTDWTIHRAAWSQLKTQSVMNMTNIYHDPSNGGPLINSAYQFTFCTQVGTDHVLVSPQNECHIGQTIWTSQQFKNPHNAVKFLHESCWFMSSYQQTRQIWGIW